MSAEKKGLNKWMYYGGVILCALLVVTIVLTSTKNMKLGADDSAEKKSDHAKILNDDEIIKDLTKKTNMILTGGMFATDEKSYISTQPTDLEFYNNLSNDDKIMIAVRSDAMLSGEELGDMRSALLTDDDFVRLRSINNEKYADLDKAELLSSFEFRAFSKTAKSDYKNLFYGEITDSDQFVGDLYSGCPTWYYVEALGGFLVERSCKLIDYTEYNLYYLYRFEQALEDGEAYVYVAAGRAVDDGDYVKVFHSLEDDAETEEVEKKTNDDGELVFEKSIPTITKENYKDFAHYRVIFKKYINDNYFYDSVEKI